jgi:hypothetical protein
LQNLYGSHDLLGTQVNSLAVVPDLQSEAVKFNNIRVLVTGRAFSIERRRHAISKSPE